MRKAAFYKILKIELLIIIILLLAILMVSVANDRRRRKFRPPARIEQKAAVQAPEPDGLAEPETLAEPDMAAEPQVLSENGQSTAFGLVSYYDAEFHARTTASGEVYDRNALTAAHRDLPFDTQVRVTNVATGAQVVVRINDRGPDDPTRILDVSERAAQQLGIFEHGVAQARLDVLE